MENRARKVLETYKDTLFGIPVVIHNAAIETTDENGETFIHIPDERGLANAVALARTMMPIRLQPQEIVMLRKTLGMKQGEFAKHLGCDQARLSRLENNTQGLGHFSEIQIRLFVASRLSKRAPAISCDLGELSSMYAFAPVVGDQLPELHFERVVLKSAETHAKSNQWDTTESRDAA